MIIKWQRMHKNSKLDFKKSQKFVLTGPYGAGKLVV